MVSVFEVGLERDNSLSSQLPNLALYVSNVAPPGSQLFVDVGQKLL